MDLLCLRLGLELDLLNFLSLASACFWLALFGDFALSLRSGCTSGFLWMFNSSCCGIGNMTGNTAGFFDVLGSGLGSGGSFCSVAGLRVGCLDSVANVRAF